MKLRYVGFCGVDDSVDPNLLGILSNAYSFSEFGVLFRPDKEGQPRYATKAWVDRLAQVKQPMRLAAHLCGSRVNELLNDGNTTFVQQLVDWGFQRVQINATAVNGVKPFDLTAAIRHLLAIMTQFPNLEFIMQQNEETQALCDGIVASSTDMPENVSLLLDESKGTGKLCESFPPPPSQYPVGYAGGIGPTTIRGVVQSIEGALAKCSEVKKPVWIDMESSLRSNCDGNDIFDVNKCYQCIATVCELGLFDHPSFL